MSTQTPNIDFYKNIPLGEYEKVFECNDGNRKQTVEEVASYVSKVYNSYLRLTQTEKDELRKRGIWSHPNSEVPPHIKFDQFELTLKNRIISHLIDKNKRYIDLKTDYCPEGILRKVAESTFSQKNSIGIYFPYKTCTSITFMNDKTELHLDMQLTGPRF